MHEVTAKLATLGPELTMLIGATLCLLVGLSHKPGRRQLTGLIAAVALLVALYKAANGRNDCGGLGHGFIYQTAIAGVGFLLLLVAMSVPDRLESSHDSARANAPWAALSPDQIAAR